MSFTIFNLKIYFRSFLMFLLLMPVTGHAYAPDWFAKRSLKTNYNTEKIGYGKGSTQEEAHLEAMADISTQVEGPEITNVFECKKAQTISAKQKNKRSKTIAKRNYSEECKKELRIQINLKLQGGTEIVQQMHLPDSKKRRGRSDGVYYVAVKYDTADIIVKTARLHKYVSTECKTGTNLIPFDDEVRRSVAEQFSKNNVCLLSWKLSVINRSIDTKTPRWHLKVGTFAFDIANYKELRDQFWPKQQSNYLKLKLSTRQIYHKTPYSIELQLKDSLNNSPVNSSNGDNSAQRLISLFSVTERGQVITLIKNMPSTSFVNNLIKFPDSSDNADLITEIPAEKDIAHELFLATLCTQDLPLSEFMHIDQEIAPVTQGYDYGRLLGIVKSNHCHISTQPIVVKHKQK